MKLLSKSKGKHLQHPLVISLFISTQNGGVPCTAAAVGYSWLTKVKSENT